MHADETIAAAETAMVHAAFAVDKAESEALAVDKSKAAEMPEETHETVATDAGTAVGVAFAVVETLAALIAAAVAAAAALAAPEEVAVLAAHHHLMGH